jgi:hypothetical protein
MNLGGLVALCLGAVLVQLEREDYKRLLGLVRTAIVKCGLREKEVGLEAGVSDPAQFSKMLNGQQRLPLDVIAAMPEAVLQQVAFDLVLDHGLPREFVGGLRMAKAVLRGGKHGRSVA